MHDTSEIYLMQIEPTHEKSNEPVEDELTNKMEVLIQSEKKGTQYRGWHSCLCGELSGSCDLLVKGYITNSLAPHYLRWHREDVPKSEIKKLKNI